jgi:Type VI secretion system/phage-baseplate injector OB domain
MAQQLFGKYRGTVTNNIDPLQVGRIRAQVPAVTGLIETPWALPSVPVELGKTRGSSLPNVGSLVWIEFENGDASRPIWSGCFFGGAAETPPALKPR